MSDLERICNSFLTLSTDAEECAKFFSTPEAQSAGRLALYDLLQRRALSLLTSEASASPSAELGQKVLDMTATVRSAAGRLAAFVPGSAAVGEQAIVALMNDEKVVASVCMCLDRAIRSCSSLNVREHEHRLLS